MKVTLFLSDGLARGGSALSFFGPKPALGVSRRELQTRLGRWLVNQHGVLWRGIGDTQRQAREFISGPSLSTRAKFMTLSRIQSRTVTGLLTGHNTLRRHLYLIWLSNSRLCRWCEAGEETSAHVLCECEALASRRHVYLGSFFLEPGDIKNLNLEAIWNYSKAAGLPWYDMGHKGPVLFKALVHRGWKAPNSHAIKSNLIYCRLYIYIFTTGLQNLQYNKN